MDDRYLEQLKRIADALDRMAPAPDHQPPEPAPADDDGATGQVEAEAGADSAGDGPTLDDLRAAVKAAAAVDRSRTVEILAVYGAKRAPDVSPEHYANAIRDLQGVSA